MPFAFMRLSRVCLCTMAGLSIRPRTRSGITLAEFFRRAGGLFRKPSPGVRALLSVRFFVGGLFGWDRSTSVSEPEESSVAVQDSRGYPVTGRVAASSPSSSGHRVDRPDGCEARLSAPRTR